jgi:hypothetical protein
MAPSFVMVNFRKVLAALPLALFCYLSGETVAQGVCDADGVEVVFKQQRGGAMELKDVKPKELLGKNFRDAEISLGQAGTHMASYVGGVMQVSSLDPNDFPDHGLSVGGFDRFERNIWEVEFPRGMYEFRNKKELMVEVIATVTGGRAVHVSGSGSTVSLAVDEGRIQETWWGGSNSLRRLQGDLYFYYADLLDLGMDGVHRATLDLCVNIRGHL